MSEAKHTPGEVVADGRYLKMMCDEGTPKFDFGQTYRDEYSGLTIAVAEANAARLAACWNTCEGIDKPDDLRRQRDELLEVVRFAVARFTDPQSVDRDPAARQLRDLGRDHGIAWPWDEPTDTTPTDGD